MPSKDPRSLQSLYPEAHARSGMDARAPTEFNVPIIKLFLLLFLPPYAIIATTSLFMVIDNPTSRAVYFTSYLVGLMAIGLIGLVFLVYARAIIARNCIRLPLIELVYLGLSLLAGWLFVNQFTEWFSGLTIGQVLGIEAAVFGVITFVTVLLARRLSR